MSRPYIGRELPIPKMLQKNPNLLFNKGDAIKKKVQIGKNKDKFLPGLEMPKTKDKQSEKNNSKEQLNHTNDQQIESKSEENNNVLDYTQSGNIFANLFFKNKIISKPTPSLVEREIKKDKESENQVKNKENHSFEYQPKNTLIKEIKTNINLEVSQNNDENVTTNSKGLLNSKVVSSSPITNFQEIESKEKNTKKYKTTKKAKKDKMLEKKVSKEIPDNQSTPAHDEKNPEKSDIKGIVIDNKSKSSKKIKKFKSENFVRLNMKKGYQERRRGMINTYKLKYKSNGALKMPKFKRKKYNENDKIPENEQDQDNHRKKEIENVNQQHQNDRKMKEIKFWFEDCPFISKNMKDSYLKEIVMGKNRDVSTAANKEQNDEKNNCIIDDKVIEEKLIDKNKLSLNNNGFSGISTEISKEQNEEKNNCIIEDKILEEKLIDKDQLSLNNIGLFSGITIETSKEQKNEKNNFITGDKIVEEKLIDKNQLSLTNKKLFSGKSDLKDYSNDDTFLKKILQDHFGFEDFRPGQLDGIKNILNKTSTLVVLSTGAGKSLIYQLPSFLMEGMTIVISPLLSLMSDQIHRLPSCLTGVALNSTMKPDQKKKIKEWIVAGKIKILYISPELLEKESFTNYPLINFICIDEAHCISEWSHNFRTSYFNLISTIKVKLGNARILALTATATTKTKSSICKQLEIDHLSGVVDSKTVIRRNLHISISRDADQFKGLISLLRSTKFKNLQSIIVYCNLKRTTDAVASYLYHNGIKAAGYHSEKTESQRAKIQEDFMNGQLRVVAATMAFGMGIDKADIRGVIHLNLPKSIEQYIQEIGRAGRDGKDAYCHVFLNDEDFFRLRTVTFGEIVERITVKKIIKRIIDLATNKVGSDNPIASDKSLLKKRLRSERDEEMDLEVIDDQANKGSETTNVQIENNSEAYGNEYATKDDVKKHKQGQKSQKEYKSKLFSMRTADLCGELDIKKETITTIIMKIESELHSFFKFISYGYVQCTMGFYKTQPEILAKENIIIKLILDNSRNVKGAYKFILTDISNISGITTQELFKEFEK